MYQNNIHRKQFLFAEVLLFIYVITVVTLSATPGLHEFSNLVGVMMVGVLGCELLVRNTLSLRLFTIKPFWPLILLVLLQLIWMPFLPEAIITVRTYVQVVVLMLVVYNIIRITGRTWCIEYGLLLGLAYIWKSGGALSFVADHAGQRFEYTIEGAERGLNTNVYGLYCCFYILFAARYLFVDFLNRNRSVIAWVRVTVMALSVMLAAQQVLAVTGSRKGMLMLVIISAGLYFLFTKARFDIFRLIPAFIFGTAALAYIGNKIMTGTYMERFIGMFYGLKGEYSGEASFDVRAQMFFNGIDLWFQSPIFGNGNEAFRIKGGFGTYSHSNPVELLCNYGVIGLFSYHYFLYIIFFSVLCLFRSIHDYLRVSAIWGFLTLTCIVFWSLFAVCYYERTIGMVLAVVLGLVHHHQFCRPAPRSMR